MVRNVIAVYRLQCFGLPDGNMDALVEFMEEHGENLDIIVPGKFTYNNKVVDKNYLFEHQLVFRTCQDIDVKGHWAYLMKLADGGKIIIGSFSRPYPVTVSSRTLPDNLTDSQLNEVTVTWSERFGVTK